MKRIVLFLLTNLAVVAVLSVSASVLGLNRYLTESGLSLSALFVFCLFFGFGGAFLSLLISKPVARWSTGARVIRGDEGQTEAWLVATVAELAERAGIRAPEVAVYEGEPNAFATGAFRNSALVAVSTGLVSKLSAQEVRAVLAHEVAHVANGDMQTMGLLQGVVNTFVMFAARVLGYIVDRGVFRSEERSAGIGYFVSVLVFELVFGLLASLIVMAYSRHREYRADWGAAQLLGSAAPMQAALAALERRGSGELPKGVAAFGITGGSRPFVDLLRSHPPIEKRIAALNAYRG